MIVRVIFFACIFLLCVSLAYAQIPTTISYQGYYTSNGQPVTATYPMAFKFYTQPSGGSAIWTQTLASVQITKGVYSVVLNVSAVSFNQQYWLETVINGNTSASRTQLTGVPYSLAPWTPKDSNVIFNGGNVAIGTSTPHNRLSIAGGPLWTSNYWRGNVELDNGSAIAWQADGAGQRFGIGHTTGGLLFFRTSSDPATVSSPALYDMSINDAGNVGIGTATPAAKLDVKGSLMVNDRVGIGTNSLDHQLTVYGSYGTLGDSGCYVSLQASNASLCCPPPNELLLGANAFGGIISTGQYDDLLMRPGGNSTSTKMIVKTNGRVGVGTETPTEKFEVSGGSINVVASGPPDNTGDGLRLGSINNSYKWLQSFGSQPLAINPLGNNVGIGTENPSAALEVIGRTKTGNLEITGGSDVAEPFEAVESAAMEAGTVMVIDSDNPGKLKISSRAYDGRVAGVVSGAGGVKAGVILQQHGVLEGNSLIAIAGRVYCKAEASSAPIEPGDLLTTSSIPGYAMKATDEQRSRGAVVGKAMSSLKFGQGLVLVLVNLQ